MIKILRQNTHMALIAHSCFSLTLCKSISLHKSCVFSHSLSLAGCHTPFWEPTLFPEFMFVSPLAWFLGLSCLHVLPALLLFGLTALCCDLYLFLDLRFWITLIKDCTWILNLCVWAVHDSFSYLQFTRHFHWSIAPPPPFFLIELWKNRLWINKI